MNQNQPPKKRFEIEIYDQVSVGEPPYDKIQLQKVSYGQPITIEASGKADLDAFAQKLKLCNQTFKIVRVLEDNPVDPTPVDRHALAPSNPDPLIPDQCQAPVPASVQDPVPVQAKLPSKPKFYRVGEVDIKEVDGKIYQRKWTPLSESESKLLRIVSEKTGQATKLAGKRVEILRWVEVGSQPGVEASDLAFETTNQKEDL